MHLDKISEAIAHFIGLFQVATEQSRMRDDYLEFKALQAAHAPQQPDDHIPLAFQSPYDFDDPDPGLRYVPVGPTVETLAVISNAAYTAVEIPVGMEIQPVIYPGYVSPQLLFPGHSGTQIIELQPPGSVAVHVAQINNLSDNDFVHVGAGNADFHPIGTPNLALENLLNDASQFLPIHPASFESGSDVGSFVTDTASSLKAFVAGIEAAQGAQPEGSDAGTTTLVDSDGVSVQAHVFASSDPVADAIYVDGQIQTDAPKLDDELPATSPLVKDTAETPADAAPAGGNHLIDGTGSTAVGGTAYGQGEVSGSTSVDLNTGSNALVNSASIINDALEGSVFAVAGNHVSLDAIVQINAWSDSDSLGASLGGWNAAGNQAATAAFNIAEMHSIDIGGGDAAGSGDQSQLSFPKAWAVTEITGDFISLNWIQQLNFVADNDTAIVASSHGVTTTVGTGGNQTFNNLSIADLGKYFDLILIGGNYYDANIISQTNVLLDDDVVGAIAGFHTSGQGSISTSDNLLWNDAGITNIGHDAAYTLPSGFQKAIQDFSGGDKTLSADVLNDSAFLGLSGLKVLYISGSVYDLQYISQTNVLGDADQIALAANSAQAGMDGDWSITTGSNALVNSARIVDVDPAAKTYFGGDHYSDELLVQTDIIRTDHLMEGKDADHLVNEAVAFLSDDMVSSNPEDPVSHLKDPLDVHPGHNDIMQSVIS